MLYIYLLEDWSNMDLMQLEGVQIERLDQGLLLFSDHELSGLELVQQVDLGQALVDQVVGALVGAGFKEVKGGEPEQGPGDSAGE